MSVMTVIMSDTVQGAFCMLFSERELTFFKRSAILHGNRPFCVFETPFGGLRANVRRSS